MRGISFTTPLIPKVLDGSKPLTRRLNKHFPTGPEWTGVRVENGWAIFERNGSVGAMVKLNYRPGEIRYIKESWRFVDFSFLGTHWTACVEYKDGQRGNYTDTVDENTRMGWRSPRFMPEFASRGKVLIESVTVERLQDITEEDIFAEGIEAFWVPTKPEGLSGQYHVAGKWTDFPDIAFQWLWDSLHKKPGERWADSPFVEVPTFHLVTEQESGE